MPRTHTGSSSGLDFTIPELTDIRDIEAAFEDFADSIPQYPRTGYQMSVITADTAADVQNGYIYNGTAGITVRLPGNVNDGDRVIAFQVGTGQVTFQPDQADVIGGGVPNTGAMYEVCSAVYVQGAWYFTPFGYSGTLPSTSTGGDTIVDLNGFRYHLFTTVGAAQFTSALPNGSDIQVFVVGGGGNGTAGSTTAAGVGGLGGGVSAWSHHRVNFFNMLTLSVGGAGQPSYINTVEGKVTAAGAANASPTPLDADLGTVLKSVVIGGPGGDGSGQDDGERYGEGGGGGFLTMASYPQTSYVHSWTTGGPYNYDCSYGARGETVQTGTNRVQGDPCVYGQCPGGWSCEGYGGASMPGIHGYCVTNVPVYETRYHCDSGGSLNGTTCSKTCSGDNTQHHSETRLDPCNAGYNAVNGTCIDPRSTAGGAGHAGIVVIKYAIPAPTHTRSVSVAGMPGVPTII